MPFPNDQFSFKTSTRLIKTSSGRAGILLEVLDDLTIERLLLLDGAGVVGGDLDQDQIIGTRDAKIVVAVAEVGFVVLVDHHEAIFVGHVEGGNHRAVDAIEDGLAIGGGFSPPERDANERHVGLLLT